MARRLEFQPVEVDVLPPPTPKERITPQNSFVNFVEENRQELSMFSLLTRELRDEETGWRSSPSFDYLVSEGIETVNPQGTISSKKKDLFTRRLSQVIFGNGDSNGKTTKKAAVDNLLVLFRELDSGERRQRIVDWNGKVRELSASFREARTPILASLREVREDLFAQFTQHLMTGYSHVFDFAEFLSNPNFQSHRENIRLFLVSLTESDLRARRERREGILDRARNTWANRVKEDLSEEVLPRWIRSIMNSNKGRNPELAQWLMTLAEVAKLPNPDLQREEGEEENIIRILKEIVGFGKWPPELRRSYINFGVDEVSSVVGNIQRSLEQFNTRTPQPPSSIVIFEAPGRKQRKRDKRVGQSLPETRVAKEPVVEEAKTVYPIGIIEKGVGDRKSSVRLLAEEEIARIIEKRADRTAKGDSRIRKDIEAIIASLREDPYGLGTKKLVATRVTIGQTPSDLRALNPGGRINLPLQHEQSRRLRVLYMLYMRDNDLPIIVLYEEGIYHHDESDVVLGHSR